MIIIKREKLLKNLSELIQEAIYRDTFVKKMSTSMAKVLFYIEKEGGSICPKELSDTMNVTTPRATTLLNSLERKGFITRNRSVDDRRKIIVTITETGRIENRKKKRMIENSINELMKDMTLEECETIYKFFSLIK